MSESNHYESGQRVGERAKHSGAFSWWERFVRLLHVGVVFVSVSLSLIAVADSFGKYVAILQGRPADLTGYSGSLFAAAFASVWTVLWLSDYESLRLQTIRKRYFAVFMFASAVQSTQVLMARFSSSPGEWSDDPEVWMLGAVLALSVIGAVGVWRKNLSAWYVAISVLLFHVVNGISGWLTA